MTNTVNPATSFIDVLKGQVETLKSERATMLAEATAICDAAQAESRNLTPAETAQLDKLTERGKKLAEDIEVKSEHLLNLASLKAERAGVLRTLRTSHLSGDVTFWKQSAPAWTADADSVSERDAVTLARSALDATHARSVGVPEEGFAKVLDVLTDGRDGERGRMARWAVAASNPAYERAFGKLIVDPTRGHLEWTEEERVAYKTVSELSRAMSLTDANGGYMVPFTLDPAILLTNDGSNNPLRRLATVKMTTTDSWNGITSAGVTAEWKAEAAEMADASPTLAQPSIPVHLGDAFIPYTYEYGMDAVDALQQLSMVLRDGADQLMATAYTTGTGTGQPAGIVTGLTGTASEINCATSETLTAADAYALQNALPARFSGNATWQSHIAIANEFRAMETTNGALQFPELRNTSPSLLGKQWHENSNMDGTYNPAATANNYVLIYGDVAAGFFIVDRIGATLELIPQLFGTTNGRPTGERGAVLWFRTGSKVVRTQALRMLDIPTTA